MRGELGARPTGSPFNPCHPISCSFYKGKVTAVTGGGTTFSLLYDDGDKEDGVSSDKVRAIDPSRTHGAATHTQPVTATQQSSAHPHPLQLVRRKGRARDCDICLASITSARSYRCLKCDYDECLECGERRGRSRAGEDSV